MKNIFKHFWKWLKSIFVKPKAKPEPEPVIRTFEVPYVPERTLFTPDFKMTKAYADQRQKAKKNRRRHPSKAMRNIYKE